MKRLFCLLSCALTLLFLSFGACGCLEADGKENGDYLRIHIRANGDSAADQQIKLAVRDEVIGYLSPRLRGVKTRKEAERVVLSCRDEIVAAADELLYSCGFFYGCDLRVDTEYFDERTYGDLTLPAGEYRAVILDLGTGKGKNWWCVAFPPLCFTLEENVEDVRYTSILYEVVKKYVDKEGK